MSRKRKSKHPAPEQGPGLPTAYEALEKSSQNNWIATPLFGLLLLYLFISIASVTDLQLIESRDTIAVPLFSGLTAPFTLVQFAYWAPPVDRNAQRRSQRQTATLCPSTRTIQPRAARRRFARHVGPVPGPLRGILCALGHAAVPATAFLRSPRLLAYFM
jgi:hypothetical protein